MKVEQFCNTAEKIARELNTMYQLGGWGQQANGYYLFDCVCLIKSILWGFNFEKGRHGGAKYGNNGVPDIGANLMFDKYCYNKSTDFRNIERGELVWMDGHIGIYIGNRLVVEATSAWNNKVLISDLGNNGERSSNGRQVYRWTHHAKCQFIDYTKELNNLKYKKGDTMELNGYLHKTCNSKETIGKYEKEKCIITDVEKYKCEYPYLINNKGWTREAYLKPYQEPVIEKPIEKPIEEPPKEELTKSQKIIQAIIDILKAILGRKD